MIIDLNEYQIANLASLLRAIGYPVQEAAPRSPFNVANTGDWVGEIFNKLPATDHSPNATPEELADRANRWV